MTRAPDLPDPILGPVLAALTERLEPASPAPLLVAFSGGGDSLALLLIAKAWADLAGRRLIGATVDHGLQPQGAAWANWCASRARALGIEAKTLRWTGEKPAAGVPAAARAARHRLIARAARAAGARVILMGHTLDDAVEAARMRKDGHRVSAARAWSPSPVWPEGRDLFILRPLSGLRRRDIRLWLAGQGEAWIEDPANRNPSQARARARAEPTASPANAAPSAASTGACPPPPVRIGWAGDLTLSLEALAARPPAARRAFLAAAIVCVAGSERLPRRRTVEALMRRLDADASLVATVGGARISCAGGQMSMARETTRGAGGVADGEALPVGEALVWDGRFEISAAAPDLKIRALAGLARRLPKVERKGLRALSAAARRTAPAVLDAAGAVSCPISGPDPLLTLRCLVEARLAGATGCIQTEAAIWRVAKPLKAS